MTAVEIIQHTMELMGTEYTTGNAIYQ